MGTSAAVNYANLRHLLHTFRHNLLFYKRFIDDGFGIWIDHPEGHTFTDLLNSFNNWGSLKWTTDGLTTSIVFLDQIITINLATRQLVFKTYQKEMNLYLYIPPHSAHPPGVLRSLIFGRLQAYWHQNTYQQDFLHMAQLLVQRLLARGYSQHQIMPTVREVLHQLENNPNPATTTASAPTEELNQIFFHLPYHPRGIQRTTIRRIFNDTIGPQLPDRRLTVAVSRPRNLRDRLSKTILKDLPGHNPSDLLQHT